MPLWVTRRRRSTSTLIHRVAVVCFVVRFERDHSSHQHPLLEAPTKPLYLSISAMDTSLSPTAFFSPSKAKQQRAQAQDWAHIETWLANKYRGRSIPPFERNEATLSALLALVAANERADEEAELLRRVQEEALRELEEVSGSGDGEFCGSTRRCGVLMGEEDRDSSTRR